MTHQPSSQEAPAAQLLGHQQPVPTVVQLQAPPLLDKGEELARRAAAMGVALTEEQAAVAMRTWDYDGAAKRPPLPLQQQQVRPPPPPGDGGPAAAPQAEGSTPSSLEAGRKLYQEIVDRFDRMLTEDFHGNVDVFNKAMDGNGSDGLQQVVADAFQHMLNEELKAVGAFLNTHPGGGALHEAIVHAVFMQLGKVDGNSTAVRAFLDAHPKVDLNVRNMVSAEICQQDLQYSSIQQRNESVLYVWRQARQTEKPFLIPHADYECVIIRSTVGRLFTLQRISAARRLPHCCWNGAVTLTLSLRCDVDDDDQTDVHVQPAIQESGSAPSPTQHAGGSCIGARIVRRLGAATPGCITRTA